ncbi:MULTISPECIES: hypothetical protein [unclassified Massilia]|uniref:hypothetical protein n=1 Tax=unclassified Massilia TaxID=2609279 RepID=UPI00177EA323|nr:MULTISPECIES: hypothetical protein [unclassified Massilia]MBD8530576.1 hypothetical protein [Massilia sp. CFBP 13647]MBD8674800.1 hypothetical protein [Massilia sp. CFBP 13721]
MTKTNEALAAELQCVLDGMAKLQDVLDNPVNQGDELQSCFHGLQHFLADEDIRAKDGAYRQMQEAEMRKLIRLLRSGADCSLLSTVHFLGTSGGAKV